MVKEPRTKKLWRWETYVVLVKKRRKQYYKKTYVKYYWGYKMIMGFKSRTVYRTVSSVYFVYVTKYRYKYTIATKSVTVLKPYVVKKPVFNYAKKCTVVVKKVCK